MPAQHSVKLIPWDDREFVLAYERAARILDGRQIRLDEAVAAVEIQRLLRADGYPNATCYCVRSVDDALAHRARCVVMRDGTGAAPLHI